ncbi:MAG: ACP S-malonyltransferase [Spirochaetaceae bacterium]|nr:MAG: ACP S-malonyltransferase [Spirochaetaceae bacterium]
MKTCFLFPGQGAQYPGMAKDLWETSAKVKDLFSLASDATSMDLQRLLFEGSEEELKATDNTQVAVTLASVAASLVCKEKGIEPEGAAGFSLGEYSALHEAGVIALEDLFPIVKVRGQLMEKAARALDRPGSDGKAGMAAVLGLDYTKATDVLKRLEGKQVYLANYSSPSQIVLGGTAEGLAEAENAFKEAGARRVVVLKVSAPFHTPLLEEARKGLEEILAGTTFSDPVKAVYANVTGKRIASGEEARQLCIRQAVSTVCWVDEEQSLLDDGFTRLLEVGPGSVLGGLWKAFSQAYPCLPAGKLEDIEKIVEE